MALPTEVVRDVVLRDAENKGPNVILELAVQERAIVVRFRDAHGTILSGAVIDARGGDVYLTGWNEADYGGKPSVNVRLQEDAPSKSFFWVKTVEGAE